jgi:hypothetical protein
MHRNHFQQSYTLQVQWIMEPIFARLGVKHEARNFGNPGLGTLHNTVGLGSIYGPDIDCLIWDAEYTEPDDDRAVDVLARQAISGGLKVPMLWNLRNNVSTTLETSVNAHVGQFRTTVPSGIPTTTQTQEEERNQTIWAARFMNCGTNETLRATLCRPKRPKLIPYHILHCPRPTVIWKITLGFVTINYEVGPLLLHCYRRWRRY